ncbi:MAG: hypothetical protein N7Q72_02500, partial [Spiroplasma sp. Tabriz.8]|nr:hypothetical protein [Spiroplasma sp. Tabriz.8]
MISIYFFNNSFSVSNIYIYIYIYIFSNYGKKNLIGNNLSLNYVVDLILFFLFFFVCLLIFKEE